MALITQSIHLRIDLEGYYADKVYKAEKERSVFLALIELRQRIVSIFQCC